MYKQARTDFLLKIWVGVFAFHTLLHYLLGYIACLLLAKDWHWFGIGLTFIYPLVVYYNLAFLTVLLIYKEKVARSKVYCFLSFFLLPLIFFLGAVTINWEEKAAIFYSELGVAVIFFLCAILGYLYFLRNKNQLQPK